VTSIAIVVAADERGGIGLAGRLPWHLPADLRRFKTLTMGKPIIMGRRTWDSIGRPLPGRRSIVISRNRGLALEGAAVVHSLNEALRAADDAPEACVIGGADIFGQALPVARIIELTRVHAVVDADTWFPRIDEDAWSETGRERHPADAQHAWPFSFITLEHRTAPAGGSRDQRG
jgi:dihydrofolate reductase